MSSEALFLIWYSFVESNFRKTLGKKLGKTEEKPRKNPEKPSSRSLKFRKALNLGFLDFDLKARI